MLVDSEKVPDLDGALLQQPQMSRDGKFIAITLRGSKRETGIWDVAAKTWTRTGDGCQINWTPDGRAVYWVHPTGKGNSRVFRAETKGAQLAAEIPDDQKTFIDLPGRPLARIFPGAVGRRRVPGLGRHQARARPRHRRLRDLPVAGGQPARCRPPG